MSSLTHNALFTHICHLEQLLSAYYRARRGKREQLRICQFDFALESNLGKIKYLLESGQYIPAPYTHFTVFDPKTRHVSAPAFPDRVIHHSLVAAIEPLFEKKFIIDSYACRKGKGTHFAAKRVKKFLMAARCQQGRSQELYVLQCDIEKYFQNIDWEILLELLSKTIHCQETLNLMKIIIQTHQSTNQNRMSSSTHGVRKAGVYSAQLDLFAPELPEASPVCLELRKGLPIGNLTSQLFANIYLNELDHFVKEMLKEKYYARYMDDFLIIHHQKSHLIEIRDRVSEFLQDKLKLHLHPKKITIKNVKAGVPFVGYRLFYDHTLIRGNTLRHLQRKYSKRLKLFQQGKISAQELRMSQASVRGHLKHADAHHLCSSMMNTSP